MSSDNNNVGKLLKSLTQDMNKLAGTAAENLNDGFEKDPATGEPQPKNFTEMLAAVKDMISLNRRTYVLVKMLEDALPKTEKTEKPWTEENLTSFFVTGDQYDDTFKNVFGVNPLNIALIALNDFLGNKDRFKAVDPTDLPEHSRLLSPYEKEKLVHTQIEIGGKQLSVPVSNEYWIEDTKLGAKFIIGYKPTQQGNLSIAVQSSYNNDEKAVELSQELKLAVLQSPYIRGQVVEVTAGNEFRVVDIGDQPFPIISDDVKDELEQNVINIFDKQEQFAARNQSCSGGIIIEGRPGNGKTMIERWLASRLRGKVTTLWVTAKTIEHPEQVAQVFDLARKLSPSLVIMEDIDMIAGSRSHHQGHCLGEMLNQLDGLQKNDSLVLVASTNRVNQLDEALADRPGRFDSIIRLNPPSPELAEQIALNYIKKCNISEGIIAGLDLKSVFRGSEFTGAQVVEIVKRGIRIAIHRGCDLNQMCMKAAKDSLQKQRELYRPKQ